MFIWYFQAEKQLTLTQIFYICLNTKQLTMTYFSTRFKLTAVSALFIFLFQSVGFSQNIPVNSVWNAYGSTATNFESNNFDNMKLHYLANGVFQISFEFSGMPVTETSTWQQVDANNYKITFDENANYFGAICGTDTMYIQYSMNGNIQTMDNVTGDCSTGNSFMNQTTWENATAGIEGNILSNFQVFPNPASGTLNIQFNSADLESPIEIVSVNGAHVDCTVQNQTNGTLKVDISNLPAGTYLLKSNSSSQLFVVE